jgi:enamine deaminase RidA (YjgF/YER057c/UK114 family)
MIGKRFFSGSTYEELCSYARVVVDGNMVYLSGTTGMNYETGEMSDDALEQTRQCFRNIEAALAQAGAGKDDLLRIRVFIADRNDFEQVAPLIGEFCRAACPANTTVASPLMEQRMKIEIEVTARKPSGEDE